MKKAFILVFVLLLASRVPAGAADWPMWRYDAARTALSPEQLPQKLSLVWSRSFSPRTPCWPDPLNQDLMPYDRVFEPVVMGKLMFVGFNDADKMIAIDTETGDTVWTYRADGPVRFPAVAWDGGVYFVADDGCLYCLDAATGALRWRFQGAPYDRRILGNARLISTWPARGAPVVVDGIVYFGAGIWPFMGTFLYALDAKTGDVVWCNEHEGQRYMLQPHNAPSFAGVAPHGAFVAQGNRLLVPGGRSVPACLDRATGEFQYYQLATSGKTGGVFVAAGEKAFLAHHREKVTSLYKLDTGEKVVASIGKQPVIDGNVAYVSGASVTAIDIDAALADPEHVDKAQRWSVEADASGDLIAAGGVLYAGGGNTIAAIRIPEEGATPQVAQTLPVSGTVERLLAANGKLFAVTLEGQILAFDGSGRSARAIADPQPAAAATSATDEVRGLLDGVNARDGYAIVYGDRSETFLDALVAETAFHVVVVAPDAAQVQALREHFDTCGLYGKRVAVHEGDAATFAAPQYMSSLTLVDSDALGAGEDMSRCVARLFDGLRPYGGQLLVVGDIQPELVRAAAEQATLENAEVSEAGGGVIIERAGPLPGAGTWTHLLGDIAQTGKSDDTRVQLPLGLLWFGNNSNMDVLPRHGHGPSEQVAAGRLVIQGIDCISARDVYTGRVLWKEPIAWSSFGIYYDDSYANTPTDPSYNQEHIPGANARGTNFVLTEDRVYALESRACRVLDVTNGKTLATLTLPPAEGEVQESPEWGYIGLYEDTLLGGADFVRFSEMLPEQPKSEDPEWENFDNSASKRLVALNAGTGEVRWQVAAKAAFLHNGIAAGAGKVFCLDKAPPHLTDLLRRRGLEAGTSVRLLALDVATGQPVWEATETAFGSFLNYSEEHDMLIQSTRPSRDTMRGEEGRRMVAYRGATGEVVWDREFGYATFPLIHGKRIVTESGMFDLETGEPLDQEHPLTGEAIAWRWRREYGCNYPIASESILTFRSGAAGFYDLTNAGGTGNFGGFKSGCSANLVAADGLLNAPDYTRTCSCAYHNQASLAMAYMPEADWWTANYMDRGNGPIQRVGVNFGAPGDRRSDDGTLWLEYPVVGGPSPELTVTCTPEQPEWYCLHSSRVDGELRWIGASGVKGLREFAINLGEDKGKRPYTVRLYFCEPDEAAAGKRVFDVEVQGKKVAKALEVAEAAGGARRVHVIEVPDVRVRDVLAISLKPKDGSLEPVISGLEVIGGETAGVERSGGFFKRALGKG